MRTDEIDIIPKEFQVVMKNIVPAEKVSPFNEFPKLNYGCRVDTLLRLTESSQIQDLLPLGIDLGIKEDDFWHWSNGLTLARSLVSE